MFVLLENVEVKSSMYKCNTEKQVALLLDLDCSTILRDMFMLP